VLNVCVASRRSAEKPLGFEMILIVDEANFVLHVAKFFVRASGKVEHDIFIRHATGIYAIVVPRDHCCALFKRPHALPLQPRALTFGELQPQHKTRLRPLSAFGRRGRKFIVPRHHNVARI